MSTLKQLSTETQELQAQIRKMAQDKLAPALRASFTELKAQIPTLVSVQWHQYTPYFNDGDECTFGLHGVYYRFENVKEDAGDYEDGYLSDWDLDEADLTKTQRTLLSNFETDLENIEDLLRSALGDHAQVVLTANGIETEEYEHD